MTSTTRDDLPEPREDGSTLFHAARAQSESEHPSWNDLLTKVESRIRRNFRNHRLPPPHALDDLVALTLQRVFRDLARLELRDRDSFWGWVHTLADRALTDLARTEGAQKRGGAVTIQPLSPADSTFAGGIPDARAPTVSMFARVRELHEAMLACLGQMRGETAEVLRLRLIDHLSYDEIAPLVQRKRAVTVRTIFTRGRRKLVECLRHRGYDDVLAD